MRQLCLGLSHQLLSISIIILQAAIRIVVVAKRSFMIQLILFSDWKGFLEQQRIRMRMLILMNRLASIRKSHQVSSTNHYWITTIVNIVRAGVHSFAVLDN